MSKNLLTEIKRMHKLSGVFISENKIQEIGGSFLSKKVEAPVLQQWEKEQEQNNSSFNREKEVKNEYIKNHPLTLSDGKNLTDMRSWHNKDNSLSFSISFDKGDSYISVDVQKDNTINPNSKSQDSNMFSNAGKASVTIQGIRTWKQDKENILSWLHKAMSYKQIPASIIEKTIKNLSKAEDAEYKTNLNESFSKDELLNILRKNYQGRELIVVSDGKEHQIQVVSIDKVEFQKEMNIFMTVKSDYFTDKLVISVGDSPNKVFVCKNHVSVGTTVGQLKLNDATAFFSMKRHAQD